MFREQDEECRACSGCTFYRNLLYDQYDLVSGQWPEAANEVVLILDKNNEITDIAFYALGLMTDDEVNDILRSVMKNEKIEAAEKKITYDDILGTTFKLVLNNEFYNKNADSIWEDMRHDDASMELIIENGYDLEIVGILRPNPEAAGTALSGTFGYTSALTEYIINQSAESEIVKEQLLPENAQKAEKFKEYAASLNAAQKNMLRIIRTTNCAAC